MRSGQSIDQKAKLTCRIVTQLTIIVIIIVKFFESIYSIQLLVKQTRIIAIVTNEDRFIVSFFDEICKSSDSDRAGLYTKQQDI